MKISLTLSKKVGTDGMQELLLIARPVVAGKQLKLRAKSGISIKESFFDAKRDSGIKSMSRMGKSPDVFYHEEQSKKLSDLIGVVSKAIDNADASELSSDWMAEIVDRHNHPERYIVVEKKVSIYELVEKYLAENATFSEHHTKHIRTAFRHVSRFERFLQMTDDKDFSFDIDAVTRETIADFRDYLRNEYDLMQESPKVFAAILADTALPLSRKQKIEKRGENAIVKILKLIKAFFNWANNGKYTENRPFDGFTIGSERFGDPFYISIEERNKIASAMMPTKHLETQRDIFIFQCLIGCRVGDLMRLTENNIDEYDVLTYAPHKTKDEGEQADVAEIPLMDEALALIEKYRGQDKQGRLFPFISTQKYNDAIKEIFLKADITRKVVVRNALTGETESRPIYEVASSHMARRAFCGNLYNKVQDPNLIGKMSGHTDGSRAFKRYRKIETETLRNVVNLIK